MELYFITGNANKFREVQSVIPNVAQFEIDLPEIQDIDGENVVREKLLEALKHKSGQFIVEDTSLYLDCLNGLPGPLIKWFLKTMGTQGLFDIADKFGNYGATAKTIFGLAQNQNGIYFFEGELSGKVVAPRGETGFGWDTIFQPDGAMKTFAEMGHEEKNKISMRRLAAEKLKDYLVKS